METKIIFWLVFVIINFIVAIENRNERDNHIAMGNPEQLNHTAWLIAYAAACGLVAVFNWKLAISVFLLKGSIFPIFYNLLTHIDPFNLSKTTTSEYDRTLLKLGFKDMLGPDLIVFVSSLILLWLS